MLYSFDNETWKKGQKRPNKEKKKIKTRETNGKFP